LFIILKLGIFVFSYYILQGWILFIW
jgi:hypothetical protein